MLSNVLRVQFQENANTMDDPVCLLLHLVASKA